MSLSERTIKCPICGRPYRFMGGYGGDQSACPKSVNEIENNTYDEKDIN